jgi:hypothetical protein
VPRDLGGLDWGRGPVALILTVPILVAVAYMAISHVDVAGEDQVMPRPA